MARKSAPGIRERVLDTAATLFYGHGIRAVGMQQIIDTAGCGKNLLYQEFPGKADLVAAYLRRTRRERDQRAARAVQGLAGRPRLTALVGAMADNVQSPDYRGCPFRNYLAEFSDHTDAAGRIATAYLRDTRAEIDVLVRQIRPDRPDVVAEQVWLVVEGMHAAAAHPGGARAAETAVALVGELLGEPEFTR